MDSWILRQFPHDVSQDVAGFQVGHDRRQVAGAFDCRARRLTQAGFHLVGQNVRQGGLAQSGGAVEQDVVEGLVAVLGGRHQNGQVLAHALLADDLVQSPRPQPRVVPVVGTALGRHDARSDLGHVAIIQAVRKGGDV